MNGFIQTAKLRFITLFYTEVGCLIPNLWRQYQISNSDFFIVLNKRLTNAIPTKLRRKRALFVLHLCFRLFKFIITNFFV